MTEFLIYDTSSQTEYKIEAREMDEAFAKVIARHKVNENHLIGTYANEEDQKEI